MVAFVSGGHTPKGIKKNSGAVCGTYVEAELAAEFRDLVVKAIGTKIKVITDKDDESLSEYLKRIQTGSGSVVIEFHFDATPGATGTTGLVEIDADRLDTVFAKELTFTVSQTLGIKNRGVFTEAQSHRGTLGLMKEEGIICLLELCFIDNSNDMKAYFEHKHELAIKIADIIVKYDNLI